MESPKRRATDEATPTTTIDPLVRGGLAGAVVAGKYRLAGEIGRGGMGVVYEAEDLRLRRPVALKFLPLELTHEPEARERFVHEAQAASALDNPHICPIHEIGEAEDGRMYIAMALCRGESLKTLIRRGPLAPAEALSIAAQIADGLDAAHARGIIHRDVKPGNVLVTKEGLARIADFGLAKVAGEARLTQPGKAVGTVAYMSPEQLRGEDVDARTDLWSLGVVLFEMLTGELPFRGQDEHSLAYAIVNGEPKPFTDLPPGTPPGCAPLLEKALAKEPVRRFATARDLAESIASVRESAGYSGHLRTATAAVPRSASSLGPTASSPARTGPRARRRALVRIAVPVLALAVIVAAALAVRAPRRIAVLLGLAAPPSAAGLGITIFDPVVPGENPADRVLAAGLAEYLRRRLDGLARLSHSWITPGDHQAAYEVREAADAARILGSDLVVTGTLRHAGDNIALTLDIADPAGYRRLASVPKTDHIANIATWQDDLVRETAAALGLTAAHGDLRASSRAPAAPASVPSAPSLVPSTTTVPAAFEAYIRGLGFVSVSAGALSGSPASVAAMDSAVAALEDAARLDPSFVAASIELANACRSKTPPDARRAEDILRSLLAARDALPDAHYALAGLLRAAGRTDEARREAEKAAALDPLFYDAHIRLATLCEAENRPGQAEAAYRAALAVRPGYWAGSTYLGLFYFYQGAPEKARAIFEDVVRACPSNALALNALGAAHFKLGGYDQAIATFEHANQVRRNPESSSNLCVLYYYTGRYADAVTMGEAAVDFGQVEYSNMIWGNLADAYRFTPGNAAKAADAYAKAIALTEQSLAADPGDVRSRARLAVYLAKTGQADRARREIEAARRAKPGDAGLALQTVIVYELAGARARALEAAAEYARLKGPMDEIVRDPFLAALRQDPGYPGIAAQAPSK